MDSIKKNLATLSSKLVEVNKIAGKGNKMGMFDAIKLGTKTGGIATIMNKITKEYEVVNPTLAENQILLAEMTKIIELTEQHIDLLIGVAPYLKDTLHVGGLVKRNAESTRDASLLMSKASIAKAAPELLAASEALEARRAKAFEKALAVYGDATGGEDAKATEDSE